MSKYIIDGSVMSGIADAIREKTGTEDLISPVNMPEQIQSIESEDVFSSNLTNINNTFANAVFPEGTELTINLPSFLGKTFLAGFWGASGIAKVKAICEIRNVAMNLMNAFLSCNSIKSVDFTEFNLTILNLNQAFCGCSSLEEILGEFDLSQMTICTTPFTACSNLTTLQIKPNTLSLSLSLSASSLLSDESIQSIIDGLADLTGADAQTIYFNSTVTAKLTDEQTSQILLKNWVLG